ncbi:uncharacterized protein LOC116688082 isoform X2 [Etheostoma spectabile]|uniref:uncharacterized protein LOC116688082 isoform X2 n=1 Tax=Etheostoma spectabile TaxID=54343 RepID=UPI0013AEF3E1|nr:uncharacterized protein LOC116688082 isoform X2 [Etheostoma spectabile]
MMKTLCVAVVVLSLTSVGHPAPLVCEQLQKSVNISPDLSGRWYCIAISTEFCVATAIMNAVYWPSLALDFTSKDTPNIYAVNLKSKVHGYCNIRSESDRQSGSNNDTVSGVASNDAPTAKPMVLLQTGCPDCFVLKENIDTLKNVILFSRRQTVSAAELNEFEKQAECLGLTVPHTLNTDHDYENCLSEDDIPVQINNIILKGLESFRNKGKDMFKCVLPKFPF